MIGLLPLIFVLLDSPASPVMATPAFSNLPNLNGIDFSYNFITGSLPNFTQSQLGFLNLEVNAFTGSLPSQWYLPSLTTLFIDSNYLTGFLPDFIGLPQLQTLSINSNQLSGILPDFSLTPSLQYLSLHSNQLSGPIPNFTNIPALENLDLSLNSFSGPLPLFNNCTNLQELILDDNPIKGTLSNFSFTPNLKFLSLNSLQLTGAIPPLATTNMIRLSNNFFTAVNIDSNSSVQVLDISSNSISLVNFSLPFLTNLDLSNNPIDSLPQFLNVSFPSLISLTCKFCSLSRIPADLGKVVILDVSHNNIVSGGYEPCSSYPGIGLCTFSTTFQSLLLSNNPISVGPLVQLEEFLSFLSSEHLSHLEIDSTRITFGLNDIISLIEQNPSLERLSVTNNTILDAPFVSSNYIQFTTTKLYREITYICSTPSFPLYPSVVLIADPNLFAYHGCSCRSGYYGIPPNCHYCSNMSLAGASCNLPPKDIGNPTAGFVVPEPLTNYFLIHEQDDHNLVKDNLIILRNSSKNLITYTDCPHIDHFNSEPGGSSSSTGIIELDYSTARTPCVRNSTTSIYRRRYGANICIPGYINRLCSECDKSFYRSGISCKRCNNTTGWLIVEYILLLLLLLILLFTLYSASHKSFSLLKEGNVPARVRNTPDFNSNPNLSSLIKILVTFTQIINIIPEMGVRTPFWSSYYFSKTSSPFNLHIQGLECFGISSPDALVLKSWIAFFLPLFVLVLVFLIYLAKPFISCFVFDTKKISPKKWKLLNISVTISFFTLMYFPLVSIMVAPFGTSTTLLESSLGKNYINSSPFFLKDPTSPAWESLSTVAILGTILYVIGIPLIIFLTMYSNFDNIYQFINKQPSSQQVDILRMSIIPESLKKQIFGQEPEPVGDPIQDSIIINDKPDSWYLFGFFFQELCSDTYLWPLVDFLRSLSIPLLIVFLQFSSSFRPFLFGSILFCQFLALIIVKPYKHQKINTISTLCWLFLFIYFGTALCIDFAIATHQNLGENHSKGYTPLDKFLPIWIPVFTIIVIFEVYLLFCIVKAILEPARQTFDSIRSSETPTTLKISMQRWLPSFFIDSSISIPLLENRDEMSD